MGNQKPAVKTKPKALKKPEPRVFRAALPTLEETTAIQKLIDTQQKQKRRALSVKEVLLIKGIIAGKKQYEAGIDAGIKGTPEVVGSTVSRMLRNANLQEELIDALDRKGITMEKIMAPAIKALDAKIKFNVNGNLIETEDDDLDMQLKGHDRLMKVATLGLKKEEAKGNTLIVFNQQNNNGIPSLQGYMK